MRDRLASVTAIAGPSLGQLGRAWPQLIRRSPVKALWRSRRSWYVALLCLPGGPSILWRALLSGDRWRRYLREVEGLRLDSRFPAAGVISDGLHGANLYRANIPTAMLAARLDPPIQIPALLIVPERDRYIPEEYYHDLPRLAPNLRRRSVAGSH